MRVTAEDLQSNLKYTYSTPDDVLPGSLLPPLRFLTEIHPGRSVETLLNGVPVGEPSAVPELGADIAGFAAFIADLTLLQCESGVFFPLPDEMSIEEEAAIGEAARLFRGETITGNWKEVTLGTTAEGLPALKAAFGEAETEGLVEEALLS